MPKIDARLRGVARQVHAASHIDVGSDHGGLLVHLLSTGRVRRGIAVENKRQPFQKSCQALQSLDAEVRFGDGLAVVAANEADSLSITGMGAGSIVRILDAFPDRVPSRVVVQPNRQEERVRLWALQAGYRLVDEQIVRGHWPYAILAFERARESEDPAYRGVDYELAITLGPLNVKRREREWIEQLRAEASYWTRFDRLNEHSARRLNAIRRVVGDIGQP